MSSTSYATTTTDSGATKRPRAIVFCEANFGVVDGKTANGLVRHSERYEIIAVIDSTKSGQDSGQVLDNTPNGIPIVANLSEALTATGNSPAYFIVGVAPSSGLLSAKERDVILDAIQQGLNIVNGLHEFLNEDAEFAAAASASGVTILDIRKPRAKKNLRMFSGRIKEVTCPRIAVLGTDGAIGKRTTSILLARELKNRGIRSVLVSTGQTGLIQGTTHGIALDAIPTQFVTGELEATIIEAFESENPDVIIIEGQGALSHPTYLSSTAILRGSLPEAVILQHAPARKVLSDFPEFKMPTVRSEIDLIETFVKTKVIGLTINHENMSSAEISAAISSYESELGLPVTDPLTQPADHLANMVLTSFPNLNKKTVTAMG